MSRRFIEDDWIEEWARVCKHGRAMVENLHPRRDAAEKAPASAWGKIGLGEHARLNRG
jgi:hypothetical protein